MIAKYGKASERLDSQIKYIIVIRKCGQYEIL